MSPSPGNASSGRCADCGEKSLYIRSAKGLCLRCELKGQGGVRPTEAQTKEAGALSEGERTRLLDAILYLIREAGGPSFDPWLSLKRLAEYLSIPAATMRDHLRSSSNSLPSYKVGRKVLVRRSDFDAWMRTHRQPPRSKSLAEELREIGFDFGDKARRLRRP